MSIESFIVQTGGADSEATALKQKILMAEDRFCGHGTVYYFSDCGNDCNDGLSPERPLKSYLRISDLPLKAGDSILFERGSVFRTSDHIDMVSGIYYGAYGKGEKPKIYGSLRNYADPSIWIKTEKTNIWCTKLEHTAAGMINFNNDESFGEWKRKKEDLQSNGDFFHDIEHGCFYLCCNRGNPGEIYCNIEIATTGYLMFAGPLENTTVENLCFKYATFGPFRISSSHNVHITNCEMGWHGGKFFSERGDGVIRYGNAVEFWFRANDVTVDYCWIYQIFDAAITFQGAHEGNQPCFININFQNNLIEYCSMNIEYWAGRPDDKKAPFISNISVTNNIIRFAGYGWGGIQRYDKDGQGMILGWNHLYNDMHDFVISDNIFDCADCYMIHMRLPKEQEGLIVHSNTFFQKKPSGLHNCVQAVKGVDIIAQNQRDLEKAILEFDSNPKKVKWLSE